MNNIENKHMKSTKKIDNYEKIENKKYFPKDIKQDVLKQVFRCLLEAIFIIFYFAILNYAYKSMNNNRLIEDIKIFSGVFLLIGILFIEKGYKKEKFELSLYGIEIIFISFHSLSIMHVINRFDFNFQYYLLVSSYIFAIYFVLKAIILYTKGKKDYLKNLSDISDIVKESPQKKEAIRTRERIKKIEEQKEQKKDEEKNKKEEDLKEKVKEVKPKSIKRGKKKASHAKKKKLKIEVKI